MFRVMVCLLGLGLVSACGNAEESDRRGRLALREGKVLSESPECGVDLPACPANLSCIAFKLDGETQVRCVDEATLCTELLQCTGGTTCAVLASYPGQVICSGTCRGDDCDESVSSGPLP
jgi:hypothetical protein